MLTANEVMTNIISHGACADGVVWATGKNSDQMWASTDEHAAEYLFWWAAKNAGQPGWKSVEDVWGTLSEILDLVTPRLGAAPYLYMTLKNDKTDPVDFFYRLVREVRGENDAEEFFQAYLTDILPIIKTLGVSHE